MPHFQAKLPRLACAHTVRSRSGASAFFTCWAPGRRRFPADSGHRRFLSSSLSICRTLKLRKKSFTVPRSSERATAGSVAASGRAVSEKFSYQQNFPAPHSEARGRGLPPVHFPPPGTAQSFSRSVKLPVEGRNILWVGPNLSLTSYSAKKCAVKEGDCCALHC